MSDKWQDRDRMLRALGTDVKFDDGPQDVVDALIQVCFRQEAELERLWRQRAEDFREVAKTLKEIAESIPKPKVYNHLRDGARSPTPVERRH